MNLNFHTISSDDSYRSPGNMGRGGRPALTGESNSTSLDFHSISNQLTF